MEKKLYKVFYRTGNENENFTFIEADGEVHGEEEVKAFNERLDGVEAIVADTESNKLNKSDFAAFVEKYEKAYKDLAEKHNKLAEIVGALKENNAL